MDIPELFTRLYNLGRQIRRVPKVKDKAAAALFRAAHRKIGGVRKTLYIAGLVGDGREKAYPQLSYKYEKGLYRLDTRSRAILKQMTNGDSRLKESAS
ncbi:MAG: hypothetical protein A2902_03615 [Elusimicrobia bacterium RIFCSPLOWO2_01_FULL_64_13]|nr:MAG: hypothetical protein A2636_05680 [Elusimicrobia bacterium RIFCSPHIGHO2_01_FULL_64_10]OGR97184.1 MAG: hypothetical protein A2902_03615 [Elusimicrobia bacterium RIFCSPLOWO2_01_FULL_64_13]